MRELNHLCLRYSSSSFEILDQSLLPLKEQWIQPQNVDQMVEAIKALKVRGAPMIALAANFFLAQYTKKEKNIDEVFIASELLKNSRPTAVNLIHAMNEFQKILTNMKELSWVEAWAFEKWEKEKKSSEKMAAFGVTLLKPKSKILTHCNTGGLAMAGNGTALAVAVKAQEIFSDVHVYVDETRPLLQGGRLTTWELQKNHISYDLICDSMAASLMQQNKVDAVFIGADRIAANGDAANKIGSYALAIVASYHRVPFYVVAPETTVDSKLSDGSGIPIEMRPDKEVRGFVSSQEEKLWAPECSTYNPAFDVVPSELISAWVTEKGVLKKEDINKGAFQKCGQ